MSCLKSKKMLKSLTSSIDQTTQNSVDVTHVADYANNFFVPIRHSLLQEFRTNAREVHVIVVKKFKQLSPQFHFVSLHAYTKGCLYCIIRRTQSFVQLVVEDQNISG